MSVVHTVLLCNLRMENQFHSHQFRGVEHAETLRSGFYDRIQAAF